ncbi:MAG: type II toxin-antitoxin system PemK/MazF family toxin [Oscillospiraceae bacterium]|jgi:mRNA interferase MazF|nr:type II toxin-antitoxin system PemK/MazF family toxin [Oscillospiraceae bacterium]
MPFEVRRGEIYFADLSPAVGSEQSGHRPVLIISNDTGNRHSPTVVAAAITSKPKKKLPTHHMLPSFSGLVSSVALLEQIRTLDKSRLETLVGTLDEITMIGIDRALAVSVGIERGVKSR